MANVLIKEISLEVAWQLLTQLPEFDNMPSVEAANARIANQPALVLGCFTAPSDEAAPQLAGVKIGYALNACTFYSWMGGVLTPYRSAGLATRLLQHQERSLRQRGYTHLRVKSRNSHPAMVRLLLKYNYLIVGVEPRVKAQDNRIILEKVL